MGSSKEIIKRLTDAGVPRACWAVSTTGTGRARLRAFAEATMDRSNYREIVATAYVKGKSVGERLAETEQLAKELVLAGHRVKYLAFNRLVSEVRNGYDADTSIASVYGQGAIVVPSVPPISEVPDQHQQHYLEAVDYLVSHAYEGGVLAISGHAPMTNNYKSGWPSLLERLLLVSAEIFEVA